MDFVTEALSDFFYDHFTAAILSFFLFVLAAPFAAAFLAAKKADEEDEVFHDNS